MIKPNDPRQLAVDIMERSPCAIKVGAVILDPYGKIISWGWNHAGSGFGKHAEIMAIERANRKRIQIGSIIIVAGRYDRGTLVKAKPCPKCEAVIRKYGMISYYRDKQGNWCV